MAQRKAMHPLTIESMTMLEVMAVLDLIALRKATHPLNVESQHDSIGAKVFVFSLGGTTTGCEKILIRLCESFPDSKNVTIHSRAIHHAQFTRTNLPGRSLAETSSIMAPALRGLSDTFEKHREKCGRPKSSQTLIDYAIGHSGLPLVAPSGVKEEELARQATLIKSTDSINSYCTRNPDTKVMDAPDYVRDYVNRHFGEIMSRFEVPSYGELICRDILRNMGKNSSIKLHSRSEEDKEVTRNRISDAAKQAHSKRSEEDKALTRNRKSDTVKKAHSKRSEEDKEVTRNRKSNAVKKAYSERKYHRDPPTVTGKMIHLRQLDLSDTPSHVKAILRKPGQSNDSRYRGVIRVYKKWEPCFQRDGKFYRLGVYENEAEAGLVYANVKYWYGIPI